MHADIWEQTGYCRRRIYDAGDIKISPLWKKKKVVDGRK